MVDFWGTDEPLYDIGPTPLRDGIVNVQDLIVLAEHLFADVNDPTLISHRLLKQVPAGKLYFSHFAWLRIPTSSASQKAFGRDSGPTSLTIGCIRHR
jgi:hypothetical protein